MKKFIALLLLAALTLGICACGEDTPASTAGTQPANTQASEAGKTETQPAPSTQEAAEPAGYYFVFNGVNVEIDALSAPVTDALGKPLDYREIDSCAGLGLEKTYFYNDFELSTYQDDLREKADCIYSVYFASDNCETAEGICLGMAAAEVYSRLKMTPEAGSDQVIADIKNATLFVTFQNGAAATIQILANKVN